MKILSDISIKDKNTLRLDVKTRYYAEISSDQELQELIQRKEFVHNQRLIIGAGANLLFTKDYEGLIIRTAIKGIRKVDEDSKSVILEANAGEAWHRLVTYAVDNNWGGIENLAYIPGTVGAAPVQNIAAYGQNIVDVFVYLEATNLETGKSKLFSKDECKYSYRESIFKHELKDKYLITRVRIKLSKRPDLDTSYFETGNTYSKHISLIGELEAITKPPYTIADIYRAVINIRRKKLPDVADMGTAGGFFKNPIITWKRYNELKEDDPDLQWYPAENLLYT